MMSGQPRHSYEWAAEALTSVGGRGTHISGQPRHSHQWAAEALTSAAVVKMWKFTNLCIRGGLHC